MEQQACAMLRAELYSGAPAGTADINPAAGANLAFKKRVRRPAHMMNRLQGNLIMANRAGRDFEKKRGERNPAAQKDGDGESCGRLHGILILDNSFDMGGLEKKLFDFTGSLDRRHFNVAVCCLKSGGYFKHAFTEMGIQFYDNLLKNKYDVTAYARLVRIIKKENIDLIYSFLHPNTVLFSSAAKIRKHVGSWIVSVHATGSAAGGRLVKPYLKPFLKGVDRFIAVANAHKKYLAREEGLPSAKIEVIHNGVDTSKYIPGQPDEGLRSLLGLKKNYPVITTVASLKPLKCVDVFLEAAALILGSGIDANFLVVGDGPERGALEKSARELGLGEKVVFAGLRDDVYDLLRLSDIFVLSSKTEAFPNVILEAMAAGLPVVATDVGSVRELVMTEKTGLLVERNDAESLAGAVNSLLQDRSRAAAFGQSGRAAVEAGFTLEKMNASRTALLCKCLCG